MVTFAIDESSETFDALLDAMKEFNRQAVGVGGSQKFNVALRDDAGRLVGGVAARLAGDSMYLDIVWSDETVRGQGHGRTMMDMIEAEGLRRGARGAWLYTMSWQARPFYEKLGYRCVGEIPFLGNEHRQYFMWKEL
ncbi:MAG TPA: GNAT family N-acetyltransferase [Rhizomicrobium sp.]|nr:GNAT family N-acetyltransferase [Rhizomicrobium sp.]